jgi:hypothetical protein
MRKLLFALALFSCLFTNAQKHITLFETSGGTESPTYPDVIKWWKALDAAYPTVKMLEMGPTDAGFPLHVVLVAADGKFDIKAAKAAKKHIILVNNGIHPGEPDGIDASMLLVRDIVQNVYKLPANIVLAFIPVYNIGGALNRSKNYRIDQDGPVEKGFRGNSQNLDLNRDFIKADSKEALSFARIFQMLDPDVFVDNHVSNGADYQYVMTLLTSQHNRLGGEMGAYLNKVFEPALYPLMKAKGFDLVPYVNHFAETPDSGWPQYWDSPRYSSGYASLFHTFSFVPETHMLKPYKQRVESTRALMESFIEFTAAHGKEITALREKTRQQQIAQVSFPMHWKLDRSQFTEIDFKGFEAGHKPSEISGLPRLYYDRTKPYQKKVKFYNTYIDTFSISKPTAYIIPQGWWKVIERLKANGIRMRRLLKDSTIEVEAYRLDGYQSSARPYEGHHLNNNVKVSKTMKKVTFRKGDYLIPMNQTANRFLMEVLEPQGEDSYFTWNFFDPILGQKEGFSDYVYEETALTYLKQNPELKARLNQRKATDTTFAKNGAAQLDFIFKASPNYEPAHLQYPVYRIK